MAVYVDDMAAPYGRLIMCHMLADTIEELHAMADAIGVARKWVQVKRSGLHYDICKSKRAKAVAKGAVELSMGSPEWCTVVDSAKLQSVAVVRAAREAK